VILVTACFRSEARTIPRRAGVHIVRTAMGRRSAESLAERVVRGSFPLLLLSTGFCGGLAPDLRCGDLVLASEVRMNGEVIRIDPTLRERARAALNEPDLVPRIGAVECVEHVLHPAEKTALAAHGGVSVDLESAPLARWAANNAVPFLSIRAVLDAAGEEMPFSDRLPLWASVVAHPVVTARIGRRANQAAGRLGRALACLIDVWGEAR
jgi:nucleoside phosphorylase